MTQQTECLCLLGHGKVG